MTITVFHMFKKLAESLNILKRHGHYSEVWNRISGAENSKQDFRHYDHVPSTAPTIFFPGSWVWSQWPHAYYLLNTEIPRWILPFKRGSASEDNRLPEGLHMGPFPPHFDSPAPEALLWPVGQVAPLSVGWHSTLAYGLLGRVAASGPQRGTFWSIRKFTLSDRHVPSRFSISLENATVWNGMKFVLFTQSTIQMEVSIDTFEAPHPSHPRHYV